MSANMDRLRKEIAPGKNDELLSNFLSSVGSGGTRSSRSRRRAARDSASQASPSPSTALPPATLAGPSTPLAEAEPIVTKANTEDKKGFSADRTPTSARKSAAESELEHSTEYTSQDTLQQARSRLLEPSSSTRSMSSQRSRLGRSNARGGSQDINSQTIWNDFFRDHWTPVRDLEIRARQVGKEIIELEAKLKRDKDSGHNESIADIDALSGLYREQVKVNEELQSKIKNEGMATMLQMMIDMKKREEQEQAASEKARSLSSRPAGMDFDGPSDSPVPSPADNRQIKKLGGSRTGSQPPSRPEGTPSEASERASKPKIVYAIDEEVAFKRKLPNKPDEQDWILGKVSRVIGEGKSRRYEVQDPFPDTDAGSTGPFLYKSSASQMVPIPPEDSPLEDYEIGKRVLALYPDTTTFYRAEVKAMLNGGADVQLLFEDEAAGELKVVTRRLVLDHKG